MSKPRIYKQTDRRSILRRLSQRPEYIWIDTPVGAVKIIKPILMISGWSFGVEGRCEVALGVRSPVCMSY
jgi:hypothetical protein